MKQVIAKMLLAVVLACGMTAPVSADFDGAAAAIKAGDYATVLREFRALAEQGDVRAQYGLGVMYEFGQGVPEDDVEAVKWYRKAAEQGYARAQNNLGVSYDNGEGVPQNYVEAVKWFRKAAEQGYARAQNNLGVSYDNGEGVPQNYIEAYKWFSLAKAQGHKAEDKRGKELDILQSLKSEMTPAQIAEAQRLANEWWETHKK